MSAPVPKDPLEALYLSRQDVRDLARHNFYIAINHGYHQRHVDAHYPGWRWDQLYPVLRSKVALERRAGELSPGHLPDGLVGVLVTYDGSVVVDDGSLENPVKEASWSRGGARRLSEQCALLYGSVLSPVLVHAPHTSTHIPGTVRRELLVSDDELSDELAAMTDSGVAAVASALATRSNTVRPAPTVAAATMSRLVFDPERFPEGDDMEAVGMGLVYTRRADGTPLRELLPSARLAWYQEQHRAYTESLERLVEDLLARFGGTVILDLHSYPKDPLGYEDPARHRPVPHAGVARESRCDRLRVRVRGRGQHPVLRDVRAGAVLPVRPPCRLADGRGAPRPAPDAQRSGRRGHGGLSDRGGSDLQTGGPCGGAAVYATTCAGQRNRTVGAMGNMTPGFEFQHSGEVLWCHVRRRLQQILQFDEEWVIDTPRSETLWSETCQQNDIARGSAAALKTVRATSGPIGFTWWGWYLPQYVDLLTVDPAGMYRLRCSTVLGRPRNDAGEHLWLLLDGARHFVPAGALVVDDEGLLRLVFSIAMDRSMAEEISQFTAGILHRHAAWAGYLAAKLEQGGLLDALPQPHPERGERTDLDEFVAVLFTAGPQAVPSPSGRPQSPEGTCLSAVFAEGLPNAVADEIGWHYRASLGGPGEIVFSRDATGDPYDYFLYRAVEDTTAAATPDFKNDPHLLLRMQVSSAVPGMHGSEVGALHEANARLWSAWSTGTANVLGGFVVNQTQDGFYVSGPSTIWPAASFAGAAQTQGAATVLSHLVSHLADQALNARLVEPSQDATAPAESYAQMLTMLTALKAMDRSTREFADLRSALVEALNRHASPSEVSHVRAELAKLLW